MLQRSLKSLPRNEIKREIKNNNIIPPNRFLLSTSPWKGKTKLKMKLYQYRNFFILYSNHHISWIIHEFSRVKWFFIYFCFVRFKNLFQVIFTNNFEMRTIKLLLLHLKWSSSLAVIMGSTSVNTQAFEWNCILFMRNVIGK